MHPNKPKGTRPSNWIDFRELRKQLNFKQVLEAYGVELQPEKGEQQHVFCPLPQHGEKGKKTFSVNLSRGIFQCFGCNMAGNVLDFAVLMGGFDKNDTDNVRKVALELKARFLSKEDAPVVSEGDRKIIINAPLDFELKTLDPSHLYFAEHKLTLETVNHFGLGYCTRGKLKGRVAIPIHDLQGRLIGYSGIVIDDSLVTQENPQYAFPPDRIVDGVVHRFDKSKVLYNAHRIARTTKHLIAVPHCHLAWLLWQSGPKNVVAFMGEECSSFQMDQITALSSP